MGQAQPPISATTQALSITVATTTGDDGTGTWTFQTPPAGVTWTGTLTVSGGVTTGVFSVYIGGLLWGTFSGGSVFGPVQIVGQGSQQLIVNGSGLLAETDYTISLIGSSDTATNVQPIYPEPTGSATTVLQANSLEGIPLSVDPLPSGLIPGYLPSMSVGSTVGLTYIGPPLGQDYVAWQMTLQNTLSGDYTPRQWLITSNDVSVLTAYAGPQLPGSGYYAGTREGFWNAAFPFSGKFVYYVTVKLVQGFSVLDNQIAVTMTGFTNPQVQAVTNALGNTLGVSPTGGWLKGFTSGALVAGTTRTFLTLPTGLNESSYAFRLHSINWTGFAAATNSFTLVDTYRGLNRPIFKVLNQTTQPSFANLDGLLVGGLAIYTETQAPAAFALYVAYDLVPISQPGIPS